MTSPMRKTNSIKSDQWLKDIYRNIGQYWRGWVYVQSFSSCFFFIRFCWEKNNNQRTKSHKNRTREGKQDNTNNHEPKYDLIQTWTICFLLGLGWRWVMSIPNTDLIKWNYCCFFLFFFFFFVFFHENVFFWAFLFVVSKNNFEKIFQIPIVPSYL